MKRTFLIKIFFDFIFVIIFCLIMGLVALMLLKGKVLANPHFLYLLIALPFLSLLSYFILHFKSANIKFPLPNNLKMQITPFAFCARYLAPLCIIISLFFGILALTRPQYEGKTILPPTEGVDLMVTLDVSGSMGTPDFIPDRMAVAKETASSFIKKRVGDRIGIVVFSGAAMLQCPLTLDYYALQEYLNLVYVDMLGGTSGTAVGDALAISTKHLKDGVAKNKAIILITDGENNSGTVEPLTAAKATATYGIKVYTILIAGDLSPRHFAGNSALYEDELRKLQTAKTDLKEISAITGGVSYYATNVAELEDIYNQIDSLEKTEFKETLQLNYEDAYQNLLWLAVLFAVLALISEKFIFIKIP